MSWQWLEDRRLWWALSALAAVLAVLSAADHEVVQTVGWTIVAGWWLWTGERSARRVPSSPPHHVDDEWARGVLADAGGPSGVAAVKALREAEPALSLLAAKELAERARA